MNDSDQQFARSGENDPHNIVAKAGLLRTACRFADFEIDQSISDDVAFKLLVGEVGELSRAMSLEDCNQFKDDVKASSPGEAFDVAFSALALFRRRGGTATDLTRLLIEKSEKWAANLIPDDDEPLNTIVESLK